MGPENYYTNIDGITGAAIPTADRLGEISDAYNYIRLYYLSKAFNLRLGRIYNSYDVYRNQPYAIRGKYANNIKILKKPLQLDKYIINEDILDNAIYTPRAIGKNGEYYPKGIIEMGTHLDKDYGPVMAHEMGHAVDNSLRPKVKNDDSTKSYEYLPDLFKYSDLFPVFRNSKSYKNALKTDFENKDFFEYYPSLMGPEYLHDARPSESYGDLMQLRYELYKNGIFDSRQLNKFADKKHLEKLKQTGKYGKRIFENFSDDDIVFMLNNIASTDLKLNPRLS